MTKVSHLHLQTSLSIPPTHSCNLPLRGREENVNPFLILASFFFAFFSHYDTHTKTLGEETFWSIVAALKKLISFQWDEGASLKGEKKFFRIVSKQKICQIQRWSDGGIVVRLIISKSLPKCVLCSIHPTPRRLFAVFSVNEIKMKLMSGVFLRILFSKRRKRNLCRKKKNKKLCRMEKEGGLAKARTKKMKGLRNGKVKFEKF